ncbi:MAG: hypothetical protein QNJ07_12950 [Woeseiaceae bacterium]|nr:hypothetical protein [Woeseiaceae bacterium]
MSDSTGSPYRVVSRKTAILLIVLVIGLGAIAVSLGLGWVETYSDEMAELVDTDPDQARIKLVRDLKIVAVATGAFTCALAAFLVWYGIRSLGTGSMPPKDSWIVEGQKIRTGPDAVFSAKLLLVSSAVIILLGIAAAAMLWRLPAASLPA